MIGRRLARLGFVLLLGAWVMLLGAEQAGAHTRIDLVAPTDGAQLTTSPARIVVRFGESLSLRDTVVRVSLASGRTVATGPLQSADPQPVHLEGSLDLPRSLAAGSYIITVTARGTDGHTVTEGYAFTVGKAPLIRSEGTTSSTDSWPVRSTSFIGSLLTMIGLAAVGAAYVASWCWPRACRSPLGRQFVTVGLLACAVGAFGDFVALLLSQQQGATEVLGSQPGRLIILRALGLLAVAVALFRWSRQADAGDRSAANSQNLMFGAAIPALLGVAGATHAAGDDWSLVTLLIGCVHLGAMALWVGGLLWLWFGRSSDALRLDDAIRFSRTASVSAAVTITAGVLLSYRLSWGQDISVWGEPYGRVLIAKIGLVAVLLVAANRTRRIVRQTTTLATALQEGSAASNQLETPALAQAPRLVGALRLEAICALAVITIAGLLSLFSPGH